MGESNSTRSAFSDLSALQRALEAARITEYNDLDASSRQLLEKALDEIWVRLRAQPTTYILSKVEFAVFNFYQDRWRDSDLAVAAKRRFWDSYGDQAVDGQ